MRMTMVLVAMIFCTMLSATDNPASINFFEGDFIAAKSKAGEEGKLFFVDFYATWCAPCKWMEQSTFTDTEVIGLLDDNYVSMKVDIDDLDGYSLKQQFQIHILPTMLIFNSKGELIERVEETLSPQKMVALLRLHNKDANKVVHQHSVNSSPRKTTEFKSSNYENRIPKSNNKKIVKVKPNKQSYRIQLGVYKEFEDTYNIVDSMKSKFLEPIIVLNDMRNGKVIYRVLMGEFITEAEAVSFNAILEKEFDIRGEVR